MWATFQTNVSVAFVERFIEILSPLNAIISIARTAQSVAIGAVTNVYIADSHWISTKLKNVLNI